MAQRKLYSACESGDLKEIQQLQARGADMDVTRPDNRGRTPMLYACFFGHFEIVKWLHTHGADIDVMRPSQQLMYSSVVGMSGWSFRGMTPIDIACQQGHLNIVQHLIRHHRIPPDTLEQWHPRLSSSNKIQLRQVAHENLFNCQSFLTLATIVRYINIEPYQVMNEETGRLVVPRSSILIFRRRNQQLLWLVAGYICGGEETRHMYHIWHLIRKKN